MKALNRLIYSILFHLFRPQVSLMINQALTIKRRRDIAQLRTLRQWLEQESGLSTEQALLLCDVCHQLGYTEAEMQTVVGVAMLMILDAPIGIGADMWGGGE